MFQRLLSSVHVSRIDCIKSSEMFLDVDTLDVAV